MELAGIKPNSNNETKSKFKTEICRNWLQGTCEYDEKCIFAHGNKELRTKNFLTINYKTKKCKQFHEQGFCQYGDRCQFQHVEIQNTSEESSPSAKTASCSPRSDSLKSMKKRLPIFVRLSEKHT